MYVYIYVTVCIHSMLLSLQIGGEWLGGNNAKTQFRRSLSEDLRGVAASLVEQLVYEGPQMVARDELLMNLKNTTVHSVSH